MRLLLFMCVIVGLSSSSVTFLSSTLYDVYDFDQSEVQLSNCYSGCAIYAATMGDTFDQHPNKMDPYASNLIITDNSKGSAIMSVAQLASRVESTKAKLPLIISGSGYISVVNKNPPGAEKFTVALFVASSSVDRYSYEIYDVADTANTNITTTARNITFISARPYRLDAFPSDDPNHIKVILAGADSMSNGDQCPVAYQTKNQTTFSPFPGFAIQPNTPIVSLITEQWTKIVLRPTYNFEQDRKLSEDGFITSPGWNGCAKPDRGGIQTFRSPLDKQTDRYELTAQSPRNIGLLITPNLDKSHAINVTDVNVLNWDPTTLFFGTTPQSTLFQQVEGFTLEYANLSGDQGFIAMHYTDSPGVWIAPQSYCDCALKNSQPVGWKASDIWLDIILIIDTSNAMAERLEEAKSMVVSFVKSMSTDSSADLLCTSKRGFLVSHILFRFWVIYNMNMSSTDNLDAVKSRNVVQMDIDVAFKAALQMLSGAEVRPRVRPVIYFLANSAPSTDSQVETLFKNEGGVVIVNEFLSEGASPLPSLTSLASDGYFFTDLSEDYANNWGVLCEANCFCNKANWAWHDAMSVRTEANRGCYQAFKDNLPQAASREMCHLKGYQGAAALVSIHDQQKEFAVLSVASQFGPHTKYWLGLQYNGSAWNWDDKSTNPFAEWDVNQPNTNGGENQCAYVVQTTGLNVRWTATDCSETLIGYVCEMPPCSAGNKYC